MCVAFGSVAVLKCVNFHITKDKFAQFTMNFLNEHDNIFHNYEIYIGTTQFLFSHVYPIFM